MDEESVVLVHVNEAFSTKKVLYRAHLLDSTFKCGYDNNSFETVVLKSSVIANCYELLVVNGTLCSFYHR